MALLAIEPATRLVAKGTKHDATITTVIIKVSPVSETAVVV